jgi:hypothetical protein
MVVFLGIVPTAVVRFVMVTVGYGRFCPAYCDESDVWKERVDSDELLVRRDEALSVVVKTLSRLATEEDALDATDDGDKR